MTPWVVMRSRNDIAVVGETLARIRSQDMPHRLIVFDNASTDGTREEAAKHADRIVDVPEGKYIPGQVLNDAMCATDGELVVFVNSDCTPLDNQWLGTLLAGFDSDGVVAVFGRQVPRPDCRPLFARDTEATFGDGHLQAGWRHCFSMASSAIRRSAWERSGFDEKLKYSEDIDWTWRQRQAGGLIRYVPGSAVYHSHNYTLAQWRRRQYGEGRADAAIFDWTPWDASLLRYSILPFGRQVLGDWKYGLKSGHFGVLWDSPALRMAQMLGRRAGFNDGLREKAQ